MRVLICEDDRDIADAVRKRLESAHYAVDVCEDGPSGYDYLLSADYDVALFDVMLPGEDGFSVVHRARAAGVSTPILFLTARDAVVDRVAGLDAGADDYLVKPFALDELMARVRVLARRKGNVAVNRLVLADLELDTAACRAWRGGKAIDLTAREYTLLEYLMRNHGIVLSRAQIESNLFNFDYLGASNVVDVYIRYLRRKVDDGFDQKLIHTVRGIGYVMRETP